jgi:hypothetical protein
MKRNLKATHSPISTENKTGRLLAKFTNINKPRLDKTWDIRLAKLSSRDDLMQSLKTGEWIHLGLEHNMG